MKLSTGGVANGARFAEKMPEPAAAGFDKGDGEGGWVTDGGATEATNPKREIEFPGNLRNTISFRTFLFHCCPSLREL